MKHVFMEGFRTLSQLDPNKDSVVFLAQGFVSILKNYIINDVAFVVRLLR